jgi:phosphoribosylformylglycinamidine synthase II
MNIEINKSNITLEKALEHGISSEEWEKIKAHLGRTPNFTELGIFSAMWNEHCSYKSSKIHLKRFPTKSNRVLQGPGENAGVIDIGDNIGVAFKMESHNHPSYIEPFQGAATGVGGILRDIFTMGARPIVLLDSLHFGDINHEKTKFLSSSVVSGISSYGNCIGVPTIGGETKFHSSYNGNILVNVMCAGLLSTDKIFRGNASGLGNPIIYVGAKTGRDGIHGASMASSGFEDSTSEQRPTVQVGDPFKEKLLLEACLELMSSDAIIGIQDMGAAGLTSSSVEMASRSGTGILLELDGVPCRESYMNPYEMMLSESQERMLLVAKKGKEKIVHDIFKKWDLETQIIGKVTNDKQLRILFNNQEVTNLPIDFLTEEAPVYNREMSKNNASKSSDPICKLDENDNLEESLLALLNHPNHGDKKPIWEQYDHMVQTNTIIRPGEDASVTRIKGSGKALAFTVDSNARYCKLNPYNGALYTIIESARNLSCKGAEPVALTNCLNFGNPENPEIMRQFSEAVDGMSKACIELEIPVVSGNVSLYNETHGNDIYPTPVIGMVGLIENHLLTAPQGFNNLGDKIFLISPKGEIPFPNSTPHELAWIKTGYEGGNGPISNLSSAKSVNTACREAVKNEVINSSHDLGEGGLAIALAESSLSSPSSSLGAIIRLPKNCTGRIDSILFGETCSRIIVSTDPNNVKKLNEIAEKNEVLLTEIGIVGEKFTIYSDGNSPIIDLEMEKITYTWENSLKGIF